MEDVKLICLCNTDIMNKLLITLWFQAQVRIEGQDRVIYYLTTHIAIPYLGETHI